MRRRFAVGAGVVAVAAAVLVMNVVVTSPSGAQGGRDRFSAYSPNPRTTQEDIDVHEDGDGMGDYFIGAGPLLTEAGGRRIGSTNFQCYLIKEFQRSFRILCNAAFTINGRGTITAYGPLTISFGPGEKLPRLAITGGVGEFNGADGTVSVRAGQRGVKFTFDVR